MGKPPQIIRTKGEGEGEGENEDRFLYARKDGLGALRKTAEDWGILRAA